MKKYLLLVPLFLFSFGFVSAEVIFNQSLADNKSEDIDEGSYHEPKLQIRGDVISSATTTINQFYTWIEFDEGWDMGTNEMSIRVICKKDYATTTDCDSAEGWTNYGGALGWRFFNPIHKDQATTTFYATSTRYSQKFQSYQYDGSGFDTKADMIISPHAIYTFEWYINPPIGSFYSHTYTYGTQNEYYGICWEASDDETNGDCPLSGYSSEEDEGNFQTPSFLMAYVSDSDTDTRIVNFSPASTLIESDNTSEIVTFTTQWYYNPTEWVGTSGYDQIAVYPTNFDTGFTYAPKFMDINASGLDTDYTTFELYTGYHHISVCFFTDWEATGDYLANLCSEYSLVVGTTTQDIPYLEVYDPLYGGQIPTGETDCSLEGSVTEKAICYLTNSLAKLFIPNEAPWTTLFNGLKTELAYKFPFGYYTRTVDIITDTATTTSPFPVLSVTTKADSPVGAGDYGFDLGSIFTTANGYIRNDFTSDEGILESGESVNIWDIIMPFINWGVYISLFIIILGDIVGIGFGYQSSVKDVSRRIIVKQK